MNEFLSQTGEVPKKTDNFQETTDKTTVLISLCSFVMDIEVSLM
jgi:hypothetical protein